MKRVLFAMAASVLGLSAVEAADVGVSISVGQPGFYGRIDIGDFPPPRLLYAKPVVIAPAPVAVQQPPLYLHVPPGHAKHWRKHCARYDACGRQVYFVQDDWYNRVYVPRYRERFAPPPPAPRRGPPAGPGYAPPAPAHYERDGRYDRGDRGDDRDDHDHGHSKGRDHGD